MRLTEILFFSFADNYFGISIDIGNFRHSFVLLARGFIYKILSWKYSLIKLFAEMKALLKLFVSSSDVVHRPLSTANTCNTNGKKHATLTNKKIVQQSTRTNVT